MGIEGLQPQTVTMGDHNSGDEDILQDVNTMNVTKGGDDNEDDNDDLIQEINETKDNDLDLPEVDSFEIRVETPMNVTNDADNNGSDEDDIIQEVNETKRDGYENDSFEVMDEEVQTPTGIEKTDTKDWIS